LNIELPLENMALPHSIARVLGYFQSNINSVS
jgi:hypothetical protein